jgi:hypothetical protein
MMHLLYCGVLPYDILNDELIILLGKELNGQWSDWGGGPDILDVDDLGLYDPKKTAAREAWEESRGMLGSESEILSFLDETYMFSKDNESCIYPVRIKYDPNFSYYFLINTAYSFDPQISLPHTHLEKTEAIWIKYKDAFSLPLRDHFYDQLLYFGKLYKIQ